MIPIKERYVVDEEGNRVAIVLDMDNCHRLLEKLEELQSIRAYDAAKSSNDELITFDKAIAEIEKQRQ